MMTSRMFEEARRAREEAAQRAGELAQQASGRAEELKALAMTKAAGVKDQALAQAADARDASLLKLREVLDDFGLAVPVLQQGGFSVKEMDIELGLPPRIVAVFSSQTDVSDKELSALMEPHGERKLTSLLLRALCQARKLQNQFHVVGMKAGEIAIEIGLLPVVTLKFLPVSGPSPAGGLPP